ncbi:MAG: DUF1844 domain-containing protein [Planctomycetota bacterium]
MAAVPEMTFLKFLQGLVIEAQVQLGVLPHPVSGERSLNLAYARATIRIVELLRDKSQGNLTPEEEDYLRGALMGLKNRLKMAEDQAATLAG